MSDTTFTDTVTLSASAWAQDINDGTYKNAGRVILSSVAGTNTITATCTPAQTAFKQGQVFEFVPANTNTGATTMDLGNGAKDIYWRNAACVGGEIVQNVPCQLYAGATQYHIISPSQTNGRAFTAALVGSATAGTQTYSSQVGRYTYITANLVYFVINLILTAKDGTTSGNLRITGLPVASVSGVQTPVLVATYKNLDLNVAGGYYTVCASIPAATTYIELYEVGDNVASALLTDADFGAATEIFVSGTYLTA